MLGLPALQHLSIPTLQPLPGLEQALQALPEMGAGAVETRLNGLCGAVHDGTDLGMREAFVFGQNHGGAQIFRQGLNGAANGDGAFVGVQLFAGRGGTVW